MFDGPTNVAIDWRTGPGVVLDLSAIHNDPQVLPLVMLAASYWLGEAMRRPGRQKLQVIDEAWAAVRHGAGYLQSSAKLSRAYGVANVLVCHRPKDLTAQNDDGTASAKIAAGLLADIETRVLLRQPAEEVPAMAELFDLSEREQQMLAVLPTGRAIWKIGRRSAVVQTVRSPIETDLFFTDSAMATGRRGGVMAAGSPPRWRIDDVLARTRLDEVLDQLAGAAERAGPGRRWHCPAADHDDHRASVTMHTDRHGHERWRCWSGDHRGDAIDLVVLRNGGTRLDAVDWLATRAGMIPDRPLPPIPHKPRPAPHGDDDGPGRRTVRADLRRACCGGRRAARCGTGCTAAGSTRRRCGPTCSAATRAAS